MLHLNGADDRGTEHISDDELDEAGVFVFVAVASSSRISNIDADLSDKRPSTWLPSNSEILARCASECICMFVSPILVELLKYGTHRLTLSSEVLSPPIP